MEGFWLHSFMPESPGMSPRILRHSPLENLTLGIAVGNAAKPVVPLLLLGMGAYFSWSELFGGMAEGHPLDHYSMTLWAALLLVRALAEALHRSQRFLIQGASLGARNTFRGSHSFRRFVIALSRSRILDATIGLLLLSVGIGEMLVSSRSFWHAGMMLQGLIMLVHGIQSLSIGISELGSHGHTLLISKATRWSAATLILFGLLGSVSHWISAWWAGDFSFAVQTSLGPHHGLLVTGMVALKSKMVPLFIQMNNLSDGDHFSTAGS